MALLQTDVVLVKAVLPADALEGVAHFRDWLGAIPALASANLRAFWSAASDTLYLYLELPVASPLESADLAIVEDIFGVSFPEASGVQASRLSRVFDVAGASVGEGAAFHYVVETDPETGWAEEIARWYDTEHMPGLASVPGCVRACRFLNHDHSPLSLACYDLMTQETLGSEPWLAVRNTDWSSRARPHFTNTLRTMFVVAAAGPQM
ncbi:hypothetical protein [Polaromonas sp.]|uniref:hypothetical protein n=1 Tax=Polaromonas sp. TaxID=1869339 RepID=UPI002C54CA0E|nr:hypothetical protein [Polaromonas sp.]HQS33561.1 hypothetical protein [Polaromonas sp.]HQS89843.1 hypothetical protein [Polaromonas sp.]